MDQEEKEDKVFNKPKAHIYESTEDHQIKIGSKTYDYSFGAGEIIRLLRDLGFEVTYERAY